MTNNQMIQREPCTPGQLLSPEELTTDVEKGLHMFDVDKPVPIGCDYGYIPLIQRASYAPGQLLFPKELTTDAENGLYMFDVDKPVPIDCVYGYIPLTLQSPSTSLTLAAMYHTGTFVWGDPGDTGHDTTKPEEYAKRMFSFVPGPPFYCTGGFDKFVAPRLLPYGEHIRFAAKCGVWDVTHFGMGTSWLLEYHDNELVTALAIEVASNVGSTMIRNLGFDIPETSLSHSGFAKLDLRDGSVSYWYEKTIVASMRMRTFLFDQSMFNMNTVSILDNEYAVEEIKRLKTMYSAQMSRIKDMAGIG